MLPKITENHTCIGIDVERIVHRILSYLPKEIINGLNEVRLLGKHNQAFACYKKDEAVIEIYIDELLGDFHPFLLKIFYPFTYMVVGMAVGHELDHHVNRNNHEFNKEASAESNIMSYVYPSLGPFRLFVRIAMFCLAPFRRKGSRPIM